MDDGELAIPETAPDRERIVRLETSMTAAASDILVLRERSHNLANDMQKLIGEIGGLNKIVERVANSVDASSQKYSSVSTELTTHVTNCRAENDNARTERLSFRREMRRYMVGLLIAVLTSFVAGKIHITFPGFTP